MPSTREPMTWFDDVGRLGGLVQRSASPRPQLQPAEHVRLAHEGDVGRPVAVEISDAGGIEPGVGVTDRRRLGDDRGAGGIDDRERRAALEIRLDDDDPLAPVDRSDARLEILEHRVAPEPHDDAGAVAALDRQAAGLDRIPQHAVAVARGRLGEPGARDRAAADRDAPIRQRAGRHRRPLGRRAGSSRTGSAASRYQLCPTATRTSGPFASSAVTRPGAATGSTRQPAAAGACNASHAASTVHMRSCMP